MSLQALCFVVVVKLRKNYTEMNVSVVWFKIGPHPELIQKEPYYSRFVWLCGTESKNNRPLIAFRRYGKGIHLVYNKI